MSVRHVYAHLPFCVSRCGYCAFVVHVGRLDRRDAYLDALVGELDREGAALGPLDTVYLGGGTPTLMRPRRLRALMDRVGPLLAEGAEVSIEANPETVDRRALRELRAMGINRISLGVQSFRPHLLAALDRQATARQARDAVGCARAAGFEDLSIDLMFGVPGQTPADLEADLADALALARYPTSWADLETKPGPALEGRGPERAGGDGGADAYRRIVQGLEDAGYRWYETANFARPGHECRHSLAYWGAADYVGIGVGAVSTVAGRRWRNAPSLEGYLHAHAAGAAPSRTREPLDDDDRRRERWMLGLRLGRGMDMGWAGPPDHPEAMARLEAAGLLVRGDGTVTLTREGRFVQNAILHELMEYA
ncbi:MAG TPA: radical SAM family heme chaperone HemW [Miltoncostaeaceae bacterium]|nr:radical SAM family heme chaperone HemW [Miltoncostaeaceae bacterium]